MIEIQIEQGSREWHKLRQGKVTGSTLKRAVGTPKVQESFMYELIASRMVEPSLDGYVSQAMEYGTAMEPLAVKAVQESDGLPHDDLGFMICEEIDDFGFSPDSVVRDIDGTIVGGRETKCPNSSTHIKYTMKGEIPAEYIHQVYCPFIVCPTVDFWTFGSYDDRNYEKPLFTKTVYRKDILEELDDIRIKLIKFVKTVNEKYIELTF